MEELEEEVTRQVKSFKTFLGNFSHEHSFEKADDEFLQGTTLVTEEDFEAEVLDWALQYLLGSKCPSALAAALARNVLLEIKTVNLKEICHTDTEVSDSLGYQPCDLWRIVVSKVHDICQQWQDAPEDDLRALASHKETVSLCAIKNSRRTMEDRHVVIQDLNALFGLQGHPQTSFFAVFDGHAGTGAACYSAVHLHYNIIHHPCYPHDIKTAMKEGFMKTDKNFISKSNREGLKSGSTALCCLLRDKEMYLAWLGDSQAILVRDGAAIEMMQPHKPDREDERERIEKLGGCVVHFGTWRVNGTLAVSRAIGDAEYKPFVSSDPDVDVTHLDGTEDFIILACDGLWDVLEPKDVVKQVYSHLGQSNGDVEGVAGKLVQVAKERGSGDNITVLAVFLRDVKELINDLVVPESPVRNVDFSSVIPTEPVNGNPFGDSVHLECGKIAFESFGSEYVKVEARSTTVSNSIQMVDDGTFPLTNPTFPQEFSSEWGAVNFDQQEGVNITGFGEELQENRSSFSPFENPFGQYEQPGMAYENTDQSGLNNQFYTPAASNNFFEYQAKTGEENLVEFENNVADWPDNAAGAELETNNFGLQKEYESDALRKGTFDHIKPFQSNLSPDAEPFVMGSRTYTVDEFAQDISHVPSQPLEAFIDAEPYTPCGHDKEETQQSQEQFSSATPDLLVPSDAFLTSDDQIEHTSESPTAPPVESIFSEETSVTNVLASAEQMYGRTNLEFEHQVQSHLQALDSPDDMSSPSPEPVNFESRQDVLESTLPENQERPTTEDLDPPVSVQDLESPQSLGQENLAEAPSILESMITDSQNKQYSEYIAFDDNEPVAAQEVQSLQSPEQENVILEQDDLINMPFDVVQRPNLDDFLSDTPSEPEIVKAAEDALQSLTFEEQHRLTEEALYHEDVESNDAEEVIFDLPASASPEAEQMVDLPEVRPDLSIAEQENVAAPTEVLTNVETIVSEVKFDYQEHSTSLVSEALVPDVDLLSDVKPESTQLELDTQVTETHFPGPAVDAIPDTVPIADDVEDDESEDGEEWKFYRSNGTESKPDDVEVKLPDDAEVPIFNGHADADISSSTLEHAAPEAAGLSFEETETSSEANTSYEELNIRRTKTPDVSQANIEVEVLPPPAEPLEQVEKAPLIEPPKPSEAPKASVKPKVLAGKTAAKTTSKPAGSKLSATVPSQKSAPAGKVGVAKPSEAQKRPAPRATAPKPTSAAPKPMTTTQKSSTTAPKVSAAAPKAAGIPPRKPAPVTDAARKVPAAKPKPPPPTVKAEVAPRIAPTKRSSELTTGKPASASPSMAVKVSKEQNNVRSKAPAATNGATKETAVAAKKLQSTAATVTSRLTAKPSSAPIRKEVAKATTVSRTASARVDVKQTKETVNKQISVVSKRVTTATTMKTTIVKVDEKGTKGPVATSSPKTPVAAANNKDAVEKKQASALKSTPKAKTPVAKSLLNSSSNAANATRSPVTAKAKTPVKTPVAAVRERGTAPKSPLKTSTPGKPIRKSPGAAVATITEKSPSKSKVEEASNEKGILDATSKENGPTENGVHNGVDHPQNGHGVEVEELQQGDADLVLV